MKGLTEELERLHAHMMVVGHTVLPVHAITSRFANRVFLIDTGMNKAYYNGRASALEFEGGKVTAYYADDPNPHVLADESHRSSTAECVELIRAFTN